MMPVATENPVRTIWPAPPPSLAGIPNTSQPSKTNHTINSAMLNTATRALLSFLTRRSENQRDFQNDRRQMDIISTDH